MEQKSEESLAMLKLNASKVRPDVLHKLLSDFGSASAVLEQRPGDADSGGAFSAKTLQYLLLTAGRFDAEAEWNLAQKMGVDVVFYGSSSYPDGLGAIYDPPLVLYVKGKLPRSGASGASSAESPATGRGGGVAIVGTRRPTPYGRRVAARLSRECAAAGLTTVSGLARGVDTVCHQTSVDEKGVTLAVLGSGHRRLYPGENQYLADRIACEGGAVISEFPLSTPPDAANFPRRNRIIAGLAEAAVVVEGGRKSGALITARLALEQGKEVFAVPGPIDSEESWAPNYLIRQGAHIVESIRDVLEAAPGLLSAAPASPALAPKMAAAGSSGELGPREAKLLELLGGGLKSIDELVLETRWPAASVTQGMMELEMRDKILYVNGQRYARK
ncbi:MAG: DNA protecting protein DprA [Elusimicrobia bacterium RIFCSPLOWO2_12_FULL_59_9]|nr:MAG: DNA protecting protein DprA [Elusimicrobia bacterium RIFCSPLOWO2_12_FULL_59_9]